MEEILLSVFALSTFGPSLCLSLSLSLSLSLYSLCMFPTTISGFVLPSFPSLYPSVCIHTSISSSLCLSLRLSLSLSLSLSLCFSHFLYTHTPPFPFNHTSFQLYKQIKNKAVNRQQIVVNVSLSLP